MSSDIKVSIGLPVYNAAKYLNLCLNSILNQSYKNWELIIINDGSTDNSLEIIQAIKDSRIRVFHDDENRGLSARLNQSIDLADGDFYCRMDSDDIMHPERLANQVNMLISSDYDVIGTAAYVIDHDNKIIGYRRGNPFSDRSVAGIFRNGGFIHPSIMGRIDWFKQNPYDIRANRCEDIELWIRTTEKSSFYSDDTPLIFYREDSNHWPKALKTYQGYLEMLRRKIYDSSDDEKEIYINELKRSRQKHILRSMIHYGGLDRIMKMRRTPPISPKVERRAKLSLLAAIAELKE